MRDTFGTQPLEFPPLGNTVKLAIAKVKLVMFPMIKRMVFSEQVLKEENLWSLSEQMRMCGL